MRSPEISELAEDAEREFRGALGERFQTALCETFGESHYRGGFRLTLADEQNKCEVLYSDMQLEVSFNGAEIFGVNVHSGFEGNMFSREHLKEYLPRIVASSVAEVRSSHVRG